MSNKVSGLADIRYIVRIALLYEYGFTARPSEIEVLEHNSDNTHINFRIRGHEYSFDSRKNSDGTVWYGRGTIKRIGESLT